MQSFGGEGDEVGLGAEFADEAAVAGDGVIGAAQAALGFAEAEQGGGDEVALRVGQSDHLAVGCAGGLEVGAGLLGEQASLEGLGQWIRGPERQQQAEEDRQQHWDTQ